MNIAATMLRRTLKRAWLYVRIGQVRFDLWWSEVLVKCIFDYHHDVMTPEVFQQLEIQIDLRKDLQMLRNELARLNRRICL
jgi:hypothetical protein